VSRQSQREGMLARLERYASLRQAGARPADAGSELGLSAGSVRAYERWYRRERLMPATMPAEGDKIPVRVTVPIPAGEGERFAHQAFAGVIGKVVPLRMGDDPIGNVRVVAVEVDPDGRIAWMTYEPGPPA